jgi:Ca-activated chloride channel family protein
MSLLWPGFLLLLGLLPLLIAAYIWRLRRRRRFVVRYSSLSLVREALPRTSRLRRHLPFALFLLAVASLTIAVGRPVATVQVPAGQTTIILALDVSRSMLADDIQPYRLAAAQEAALSYIRQRAPGTQIGIVAFAGFAETILLPTSDQESLEMAIKSLTTARGTAMGSGILESIDVIADSNNAVAPSVTERSPGLAPTPVPEGTYVSDIIVVLTDGVTTTGPEPLDAAQQAVERGVRVYTIGFGTENGGFGSGGSSSSGQFGGGFRRGIDEDTLKQVADRTGGSYYAAESAAELAEVFKNLPNDLMTRPERMEISVFFTAIGALFAALAIVLALIWNPLL